MTSSDHSTGKIKTPDPAASPKSPISALSMVSTETADDFFDAPDHFIGESESFVTEVFHS